MKVLILSQHYWPETFRINEIVESLMHAGCDVTVLTGQPNYPDGKVFDGYRASGFGSEQHPAGYTVYRVPLVPRGRGGARRLVANYLSFLSCACTFGPWFLRGRRFDVVFVYGTSPILQAIAGIILRQTTGAALVTWVQDLWPQSLEATGFVRNQHLLGAVAAVVRWIYRHTDLLLVQSMAFTASVRAMAGGTPIEYHPNPGELAFSLHPVQSQTDTTPALRLPAGFNVVFAGNLGTVQALDTVLAAAELLLDLPDVRFVLVGSGARSAWLAEEVIRRKLTNVSLPGRFPPQAIPAILNQASALLVTLNRSPIMSQTVPSKIQAYLAAGRPVIASLDGEGARVVAEAGAGLACPAEDAEALAQAVRALRSSSSVVLQGMSLAGHHYYQQHFDPELLAHRLKDRFRQAMQLRKQG